MSNKAYNSKDLADIQQPLDNRTGYSNPHFDKLYGHKTKNPFWGTERDIKNRKMTEKDWSVSYPICDKCGKKVHITSIRNGEIEYQLCQDCNLKRIEDESKSNAG